MACLDLNDCLEFIEKNESDFSSMDLEGFSYNSVAPKSYSKALSESTEDLSKNPKCSCCKNPMLSRFGPYGKFYHCKCPSQKAISSKQWELASK